MTRLLRNCWAAGGRLCVGGTRLAAPGRRPAAAACCWGGRCVGSRLPAARRSCAALWRGGKRGLGRWVRMAYWASSHSRLRFRSFFFAGRTSRRGPPIERIHSD